MLSTSVIYLYILLIRLSMSLNVEKDVKTGSTRVTVIGQSLPDGVIYHFRIRLAGDTKDIALMVSHDGTCQIDPFSKTYTITAYLKNVNTGTLTIVGSATVDPVVKSPPINKQS